MTSPALPFPWTCATLRLVTRADGPPPSPDELVVVLDPGWAPADHLPGTITIRDAADEVLGMLDPIALTSNLLDDWADATGVVDILTIGRTSAWFGVRLRHWIWLQERVLWAHLVRQLVATHRPARIIADPGLDLALRDILGLLARSDGLEIILPPDADALPAEPPVRRVERTAPIVDRIVHRLLRTVGLEAWPLSTMPGIRARVDRLAAEPERRLLVVHAHARQVVATPAGPRRMNPYLGPVEDRLRGTRLEPIVLERNIRRYDDAAMADLTGPGTERHLPYDAVLLRDVPMDPSYCAAEDRAVAALAGLAVPVPVAGLDLGPALAADVAALTRGAFALQHQAIERCAGMLRRLRPAAVLLADEYHRQDWMEAASRAGVPIAAVQHGTINRHHRGYIHRSRPDNLHLVDRTYVFGRWEHDRLVGDSVYREDEVVVAGSPRLEMYAPSASDRADVRRELGIAEKDRLVVLSGTWGTIYRRFHYPVVLARLFDRPLPNVHLVVKLHPAEADEGPYRAVIEAAAAAGGFAPPPITVVRQVDLYRLLAAADAHLGVHSTVLTEAVFVGTPNLLASGICGGDLLDYVSSGVALPVRDGAELLAALDAAAAGAITDEARAAFIAHHYEPGPAAERIAQDLLEWLPSR